MRCVHNCVVFQTVSILQPLQGQDMRATPPIVVVGSILVAETKMFVVQVLKEPLLRSRDMSTAHRMVLRRDGVKGSKTNCRVSENQQDRSNIKAVLSSSIYLL
jgi:hypothetical protein